MAPDSELPFCPTYRLPLYLLGMVSDAVSVGTGFTAQPGHTIMPAFDSHRDGLFDDELYSRLLFLVREIGWHVAAAQSKKRSVHYFFFSGSLYEALYRAFRWIPLFCATTFRPSNTSSRLPLVGLVN